MGVVVSLICYTLLPSPAPCRGGSPCHGLHSLGEPGIVSHERPRVPSAHTGPRMSRSGDAVEQRENACPGRDPETGENVGEST